MNDDGLVGDFIPGLIMVLVAVLVVVVVTQIGRIVRTAISSGQEKQLLQLVQKYEVLSEQTAASEREVAHHLERLDGRVAAVEHLMRSVE